MTNKDSQSDILSKNWLELGQDTGLRLPTLQPVQLSQAPSKRACGIDKLPRLGEEAPKMHLLTSERMSVSLPPD